MQPFWLKMEAGVEALELVIPDALALANVAPDEVLEVVAPAKALPVAIPHVAPGSSSVIHLLRHGSRQIVEHVLTGESVLLEELDGDRRWVLAYSPAGWGYLVARDQAAVLGFDIVETRGMRCWGLLRNHDAR